jgi:antirestriction protein ArdC
MTNKEITKNNVRKVKELIEEVKELTLEQFKAILDSLAHFHSYSLYNQIILCFAGCSQVAGYKKWKELGRTVKKGGKATWILAPWLKPVKVEKEGEEEKERKILHGFFSVPVFDISQTEGEPIKRGLTTGSDIDFEELRKATKKAGWTVVFKPLEIATGGYVTSENGEITLNSNLDETENIGTLVHEWVHKELKHPDNGTPYKVREQQAETATYLVCKVLGIERKSVFYLKSWGLSENILKDFGKVNKVTKKIINALATAKPTRAKEQLREHTPRKV